MVKLVVGATDNEIAYLVQELRCRREKSVLDCDVYQGLLTKGTVVIIRSGAGIANAAAATALGIDRYQIEHVYNVGVCGVYSHDSELLGKVVVGLNAVFADTGIATEQGFRPLESMDLPLGRTPEGTKIYNIIPLNVDHIPKSIQRCDFSTVSIVSGTSVVAEVMRKRFKLDQETLLCEDMESAAVALVALKAGLPCTVFRGISNLCGQTDHSQWKLKEAALAAQKKLLSFL